MQKTPVTKLDPTTLQRRNQWAAGLMIVLSLPCGVISVMLCWIALFEPSVVIPVYVPH